MNKHEFKEWIDAQIIQRRYPSAHDFYEKLDSVIAEENAKTIADHEAAQRKERFIKPTDKQLIEIMILFNDGKIQKQKLSDMLAATEFVINRLYENGDVSKKSSKELPAPFKGKEGK